MRHSRTSEALRPACSPSARRCDGARAARSVVVGATCRRSGPWAQIARTIVCSRRRARLASISWPQNARSIACATVPTRIGRSPRRTREAGPSIGSSRTDRRKSEWSSSSARIQRSRSTTVDDPAVIVTVPSVDCHARSELRPPIDREHSCEEAVSERARCVARQACRERERVRAAGSNREFDRQRSERMPSGVARMPSSAARSSTSSASDSWPCSRSSRPQERPRPMRSATGLWPRADRPPACRRARLVRLAGESERVGERMRRNALLHLLRLGAQSKRFSCERNRGSCVATARTRDAIGAASSPSCHRAYCRRRKVAPPARDAWPQLWRRCAPA